MTAPTPSPLRVGDRVRALRGDGFVTEGMTGVVVNVMHHGYGGGYGAVTKTPRARVLWSDDTSCLLPISDLECTSRAVLMPPGNTVTALSPDLGGAA